MVRSFIVIEWRKLLLSIGWRYCKLKEVNKNGGWVILDSGLGGGVRSRVLSFCVVNFYEILGYYCIFYCKFIK